jgi:hypothetical protein
MVDVPGPAYDHRVTSQRFTTCVGAGQLAAQAWPRSAAAPNAPDRI